MLSIKHEPDELIHDRSGNTQNKEDTVVIHCGLVVNGRKYTNLAEIILTDSTFSGRQ